MPKFGQSPEWQTRLMGKRVVDHLIVSTDPLAHTTASNAANAAAERIQLAVLMAWGLLVPLRWIEARLKIQAKNKRCITCKKSGHHDGLSHWRFMNLELKNFLGHFVEDPSDSEMAYEEPN